MLYCLRAETGSFFLSLRTALFIRAIQTALRMADGALDWGFTEEELNSCLKVVGVLREKPQLLFEDERIHATELYRYINPRKEFKKAVKNFAAERNKHGRALAKQKDQARVAKTQMRRDRNAALERILAVEQSAVPMLEDAASSSTNAMEVARPSPE